MVDCLDCSRHRIKYLVRRIFKSSSCRYSEMRLEWMNWKSSTTLWGAFAPKSSYLLFLLFSGVMSWTRYSTRSFSSIVDNGVYWSIIFMFSWGICEIALVFLNIGVKLSFDKFLPPRFIWSFNSLADDDEDRSWFSYLMEDNPLAFLSKVCCLVESHRFRWLTMRCSGTFPS